MDVTSLLNTSSAAAANRNAHQRSVSLDQTPTPSATGGTTATSTAVPTPERTPPRRTSSGSRSPNRNRTPWDAGGYSLPLTLDTKLVQTPSTARPAFYSESPTDGLSGSPKSPKHKFSDSRSSLSSYTSSSNNSQSHSRISSLSTVSEFQPLTNLISENVLDPRLPTSETFDMSVLSKTAPVIGEVQPPSPSTTRPMMDDALSPGSGKISPKTTGNRPGSPSDKAMMGRVIERPGLDPETGSLLRPESSPTRAHKRAVSAPDFAPLNTAGQPSIGVIPESSEAGGSSQLDSEFTVLDGTIKCMYIENCDTNSQPRKAISHIFGRNKLCTRLIPNYVWVHYCRKHYQRSRYRNAQEYAKLQCELVLKQIARVQAWSDANKNQGKAGVVQDWSLTVRKREQKRLDDKSKKRRFQDDELEDMNDFGDHAVAMGTAVPQWLLEKTASGYSTAEIEAVVRQLKLEMDENRISQIPDIEILPNITTDAADEAKAKAYPKRKTSTGNTHKRSHSMGVSLRAAHEPFPMTRRVSQPNTGYWAPPEFVSPVEKRPRIEGEYEDFYGRNMDRVVPTIGRRMGPLPHRPAFNNIRENQTEDRFYDERQPGAANGTYNFGMASGPHGPLPAPTPQRVAGPHMTEQLESGHPVATYQDARATRPSHQRSYSDVSAFHQSQQMTYRPASSQGYPVGGPGFPGPYGYDAPAPMPYATEYQNPYVAAAPTQGPPGYYEEIPSRQPQYAPPQFYQQPAPQATPMGGAPRHMRHQSTPNAAMRPMQQMARTLSGPGINGGPMQGQYDGPPPGYHVRNQSYAAPRGSMPRVDEDRDSYAPRH